MSLLHQNQASNDVYTAPQELVYSVAEYISLLNVQLKPLKATVKGEIGKVTYTPRAVFFSLFGEDKSVLNCVAWPGRLQSLGIELKDGMEVMIQGYPDVYPANGQLKFKADIITPVGEGALKLAFEKLKKELEVQGYFQPERKQVLPPHIERIGLITSESGVVIRDFLTGLGDHGLQIHFYDVRVEGLNAIENIVSAIQWFNEHPQGVQVLVIARGGGSLERLQPFNSLEVAKAIYGSKIPVMSAIGHELDVTIADMVADVRASVPMDAGQRLSASWRKAGERIDTMERAILASFKNTCRQLEASLSVYGENFTSCYAKSLSQSKKHLADCQQTLMRCFRDVFRRMQGIETNFQHNDERFAARLAKSRSTVDVLEQTIQREAGHFFTRQGTQLTTIEEQFQNNYTRFERYLRSLRKYISMHDGDLSQEAKRWFLSIRNKVTDSKRLLLVNDPKLKLKQGFSIVKDKDGKVLKSVKTVAVRDIIKVELSDGILDSKVEDIY
jgi:exodeoxyribonuclease VII large subunit